MTNVTEDQFFRHLQDSKARDHTVHLVGGEVLKLFGTIARRDGDMFTFTYPGTGGMYTIPTANVFYYHSRRS